MSGKLQPALLGGLFIGVLSTLPYISRLNACCCLWVIAGGVLTTWLLREQSPKPLIATDAALAGLLAGLFAAIVGAVLGQAIALVSGTTPTDELDQVLQNPQLPPEAARFFERLKEMPSAVWFLLGLAVQLIIYPIFAMLGALLGVPIFKKNQPPPPGTVEILPPEQPPM
jgi:hypothetical protein